jgi:hypothetical protein
MKFRANGSRAGTTIWWAWKFLVVGAGIDPATSRLSGGPMTKLRLLVMLVERMNVLVNDHLCLSDRSRRVPVKTL